MKTYQRPNASCCACGWTIRNDMATTNAAVRDHYCLVCDPNGKLENRTREANGEVRRFDLQSFDDEA